LKQGGLSTRPTVEIGVGVTIAVLAFLALAVFAFWYARPSAIKKKEENGAGVLNQPEVGPGTLIWKKLADTSPPLSSEEEELGRENLLAHQLSLRNFQVRGPRYKH
jgi:hypothetical protein